MAIPQSPQAADRVDQVDAEDHQGDEDGRRRQAAPLAGGGRSRAPLFRADGGGDGEPRQPHCRRPGVAEAADRHRGGRDLPARRRHLGARARRRVQHQHRPPRPPPRRRADGAGQDGQAAPRRAQGPRRLRPHPPRRDPRHARPRPRQGAGVRRRAGHRAERHRPLRARRVRHRRAVLLDLPLAAGPGADARPADPRRAARGQGRRARARR